MAHASDVLWRARCKKERTDLERKELEAARSKQPWTRTEADALRKVVCGNNAANPLNACVRFQRCFTLLSDL